MQCRIPSKAPDVHVTKPNPPYARHLDLLATITMFFNPSAQSWRPSISPLDSEVLQFHHRLPDYNITPLVSLPQVAKELGVSKVFVKDESSRFGLPAFKILGASWAIYKAIAAKCQMPLDCNLESLGFAAQARGLKLVTCTEGNWGRATARMAKYLNIPAIVFVPDFMDEPTQEKISNEGAKVVVVDGDYDVSIDAARKEAQSDNGLLVMDTSWPGYEEIPQVSLPRSYDYRAQSDPNVVGRGRLQYDALRNRSAIRNDWATCQSCSGICGCRLVGTGGVYAL